LIVTRAATVQTSCHGTLALDVCIANVGEANSYTTMVAVGDDRFYIDFLAPGRETCSRRLFHAAIAVVVDPDNWVLEEREDNNVFELDSMIPTPVSTCTPSPLPTPT